MTGSKGHTKARTFDFAEDTVNAGFEINTDPVQTLTNRLDAGIQAVSNREALLRARSLPGVHFGAPAMGEKQVLTQFSPKSIQAWSAPQEVADEIRKQIDLPEFSKGEGNAYGQQALQAYRSVITSIDLGSATLQTGRTAFRNPAAWMRGVAGGVQALFRQPLAYVAKNQDVIDRGIKAGAIVSPTDFLFPQKGLASAVAGVSPGTAKTPLGKAYSTGSIPLRASNRFMQWNIFVAQTELYKAAEGTGGKGMAELVSLGKAIRHQTGTESYAILGVKQKQRDLEAIALFAPRFFRAVGNELGQAVTVGPGGNEARKSLGMAFAGMTALTAAANYAQGRSTNFTDPYAPNWGRFKLGDSWVSAYGPLHNWFRTAARMGHSTANGDPARAAQEAGRFLQSKESVALGLLTYGAEVAVNGETRTIDGELITRNPVTWRHALQAPITPENVVAGLSQGRSEALLNLANVNIRPEDVNFKFAELRNVWQKDIDLYQKIPSNPREAESLGLPSREAYRTAMPQKDAELFILGYTESLKTDEAKIRAYALMKKHGLGAEDIQGLTVGDDGGRFDSLEKQRLRAFFTAALEPAKKAA